jgi:GT2 family glycosyltransferase
MSPSNHPVSVIIPTHNRSASLKRTLDALLVQTYPVQKIDVTVVADGCTDATVEMLQSYQAPFALTILQQPGQGVAAARNLGAATATGDLLLFLDDDVEPSPSLIDVHVKVHQTRPGHVVMGPYVPLLYGHGDFFRIVLRAWWYDKFEAMSRAGHRYTYRDLLSGNLSLSREVFSSAGGFDSSIRSAGGEDYEFGARLIKAGVPFHFATDALAYHHEQETTDLDRALQRLRQEGYADVVIGRRHPDLRPTLLLVHFQEPKSVLDYIVHALAFRHPGVGDRTALLLRQFLRIFERLRLRTAWRKIFGGLLHYWYLRGAAKELGTAKALDKFYQGGTVSIAQADFEIEIDLADGLKAAEQELDHVKPAGVRLRYREHTIGRIPPQPGAEPLRGEHLRPILARSELAWPLLRALVMEAAWAQQRIPTSRRPTIAQLHCEV